MASLIISFAATAGGSDVKTDIKETSSPEIADASKNRKAVSVYRSLLHIMLKKSTVIRLFLSFIYFLVTKLAYYDIKIVGTLRKNRCYLETR